MLQWNYLEKILDEKKEYWAGSGPTKHVLIDNFLDLEDCKKLIDLSCVARKLTAPASRTHKHVRGKSGCPRPAEMIPSQVAFFQEINSPEFVRYIEKLTGIEPLYADDLLNGGGLHVTRPGGYLNIHTDFNFQPERLTHRRLNLLLYLNPEWHDDWNGHIELWDKNLQRPYLRAAPLMNRVLIFETSEESYHGHPEPLRTPPGVLRLSLAVYYYSLWPEGLAQRAQTGYQLSRQQWADLISRIEKLGGTASENDAVKVLEIDFMTRDIRIGYKALRSLEGDVSEKTVWSNLITKMAQTLYERPVTRDEMTNLLKSAFSENAIRQGYDVLCGLRSAVLTGERYWEYPNGVYSLTGPEITKNATV